MIPFARNMTAGVLIVLLGTAGCGPSRSELANAQVDRLAEQAAVQFKKGRLDEADRTIQEALAVDGATRRKEALSLAAQIATERRRSETEAFRRQASEVLQKAVGLMESKGPHAAGRWIAESVTQDSPIQRELAQSLFSRIAQVSMTANGMRYWKQFDLSQMTDFREKDRLPEGWEAVVAKGSGHDETLRRLWQINLRRTLGPALAAAEVKADRMADPDYGLPSPTIEEVAADPEKWIHRQVRFDGVLVDGHITPVVGQGRFLTVTSPAKKVYQPYLKEGALVFTVSGMVAKQLESFVSPDQRARARLFCKIVHGRQRGAAHGSSFYQAVVYKVELFEETANDE